MKNLLILSLRTFGRLGLTLTQEDGPLAGWNVSIWYEDASV